MNDMKQESLELNKKTKQNYSHACLIDMINGEVIHHISKCFENCAIFELWYSMEYVVGFSEVIVQMTNSLLID